MHEESVTYEQAQALKRLGFRDEVFAYYDEFGRLGVHAQTDYNVNWDYFISAPTLSHAQKWLLSNHKIFVTSDIRFSNYRNGDYSNPEYQYITVDMRKENVAYRIESDYNRGMLFNSPEEALSAGITECLKLLENETSKTSEKDSNP